MVKALLDSLKSRCEAVTESIILPMKIQKGDAVLREKSPSVYRMRLPIGLSVDKYAPYIILQYVNSKYSQPIASPPQSEAVIRLICCVCNEESEEDGALELLNVMEAVQQSLLINPILGDRFKLDNETGIEMIVYPDDTAPYFAGEMVITFCMPPIHREVNYGN